MGNTRALDRKSRPLIQLSKHKSLLVDHIHYYASATSLVDHWISADPPSGRGPLKGPFLLSGTSQIKKSNKKWSRLKHNPLNRHLWLVNGKLCLRITAWRRFAASLCPSCMECPFLYHMPWDKRTWRDIHWWFIFGYTFFCGDIFCKIEGNPIIWFIYDPIR